MKYVLWILLCQGVWAQAQKNTEPAGTPPTIELKAIEKEVLDEKRRQAGELAASELFLTAKHWSRLTAGFWLGYQSWAITGSHFLLSQDSVMAGQSSETFLGFGFQMDVPVKDADDLAYRMGLGYGNLGLTPNDTLLAESDATNYEDSGKVVWLSSTIKKHLYSLGQDGVIWGGAGMNLTYLFTSRFVSTPSDPQSRLEGSVGLSGHLAVGWDWPLSLWNDVTSEIQWKPFGAFGLRVGMRTSL